MSGGHVTVPTAPEIRQQLVYLLERLRLTPQQKRMLAYVVEKQLAEEPISAKVIGLDILPSNDPTYPNVRVVASTLRKSLADHYLAAGKGDLVVIELLANESYSVTFSYNTNAESIRIFDTAVTESRDLRTLQAAVAHFRQASDLGVSKSQSEGYVAEAVMLNRITTLPFPGPLWSGDSELRFNKSLREAFAGHFESARALRVLGLYEHLGNRSKAAAKTFSDALAVDPDSTNDSLWYAAYLLGTGNADQANKIAASRADRDPYNEAVRLFHALVLYIRREYKDAAKRLVYNDSSPMIFRYVDALINYGLGNYNRAKRLLRSAYDHDDTKGGLLPRLSTERLIHEAGLLRSGLFELCQSKRRKPSSDMESYWLTRYVPVRPFENAIAHMAFGDLGPAVRYLAEAQRDGDLAAGWLHLWPFLDPLREHAPFNRLLNIERDSEQWKAVHPQPVSVRKASREEPPDADDRRLIEVGIDPDADPVDIMVEVRRRYDARMKKIAVREALDKLKRESPGNH